MNPWVWILALGVGTYAIRASFVLPRRDGEPSAYITRVLRLVPAAVLSALALPALVFSDGELAISLGNDRLLAGIVAGVVAWRTRNVSLTLIAGMVVFWTLSALR